MADIQYLNYGDLQIELLALLNNLANNVQSYVQNLPWSNKRKEKFMSAYSDLMNRGLLGASNSTGQWMVDVGGEDIPFDTMSKKDKEMYQEAAYFIQQQMAGLPTKASEEEQKEKEKSELPTFDNKYFTENLGNHISNQMFGGRPIDTQTDWNSLDERGENGLRGTNKRAEALANMLESYSNSLEEGKHNFEGSPFKDLNDFKSRITNAVSKLRDGTWNQDDKDALNLIGLNSSDWFNDGSGDTTKIRLEDGTERELTYAELADYNNLIEQDKLKLLDAEELARRDEVKKKHNEKIDFFRRYGVRNTTQKLNNLHSLNQLADKYGSAENLANKLREYSKRGLKLNPDEMDEMLSAFHHGANSPISDNEYYLLLNYTKFKGGSRNRFKKFKGVDDLIYDTSTGRVILLYDKAVDGTGIDFLAGQSSKNKQQEYLQNTEWTADQTRELIGIAADVASVIDPEPFTAGGLALTGTGLRTYNRWKDADGFTWTDAGHTALDAGLSLLGMIPVVGDAALAARVIGKLQKAAGWLGAAFAAASVPLAAKAAWNKVVNGQDMTVDDWRAIGNVLMGATQARRIQLNRAAGNAVKNQGGTTSKEKIGEVEVKIGGKTEKVEIDEISTKELQKAYKSAGNDHNATNEALRKSNAVRKLLEAKKTSDGKPIYTKEQLDAMEAPQAALGKIKGKVSQLARTKDIRGIKTSERTILTSGTPISELNLGPLARMRINAMLNNQGWFNRGDFGWNMRTRGSEQQSSNWFNRMWQNFKNPYKPKQLSTTSKQNSTELNNTREILKGKLSKEQQVELRETLKGKNFGTNDSKYGTFEVKGLGEVLFSSGTNGASTLQIKLKDGTIISQTSSRLDNLKLDNLRFIKSSMRKISQQLPKDLKAKINLEFIKKLKEVGALKQGGKITDTQIDNFLKQYK